MSTIETEKAERVERAAGLADTLAQEQDRTLLRRFIAELYEHVPPADIAGRSSEDLFGAALALWRFAAERQPAAARLRVYNPNLAADGWSSPNTIVEIVNDDMPFLVDSVTVAVNDSGREVRLVIHPVFGVRRDPSGRLIGLGPDETRESWMQIVIAREPETAERDRLADRLRQVLGDVRAAVSDWTAMRAALQEIVTELQRPPPLLRDEIDEGRDFLRWLDADNFTYLGFRDYVFGDPDGGQALPPLGILHETGYLVFGGLRDLAALPRDVQNFLRRRELLIVAKTDRRATVHRNAHMDAIAVRRFGPDGAVIGLHLFVGLFTSVAYSHSPRSIPLLRRKVERVMARSGLPATSHDGKALLHILDTFPRDELFQIGDDELFATATGILNLQERQRIALFVRRDPLERFISCLVYVPRDRYNSELRQRFAAILEPTCNGKIEDFFTHLDESVLARVQFILRTTRGKVPAVDVAVLEHELAEAGRSWTDWLQEAADAALGETEARAKLRRFAPFPLNYQLRTAPAQAVLDLDRIEAVSAGAPLEALLRPDQPDTGENQAELRLYRRGEPVILSDVLPILENLGLRIVAEEPYRIDTTAGDAVWVHEFTLAPGPALHQLTASACRRFEDALVAAWTGEIESDGFNRLVLAAGLSARQTVILRLYAKFLRQAGSGFSQAYMEETLARHPAIAARLVSLFELRFDPARGAGPDGGDRLDVVAEVQAIDHTLDAVDSLDEDRILRNFLLLVLKSLRTNYFQPSPSGAPKPYLSAKFNSAAIELLPLPRPLYEIFVYSPRVEAVHMRAGRVARGGIRWSDRREDFRTEILGLMKAQTVKNAVIVPVGSKGGFVVKRPPATTAENWRDRYQAEGIECYRTLIRGLLDITDNIVAEGGSDGTGHRIAPPPQVVRHDGDDPYLVVAADKGTATFSDIANGVAEDYGFWLGDAFASGGSKGYDHKAMGITSRGAWELVKRHFRELGRDIQTEDFTVVGVGDMAGDVFGNGMLQSRHIRLLGAFNHLHVFIDPDPDPASSYAERERLFRLPRSSWADYDTKLISAGGGIFERAAKSIAVSAEMKRAFGISEDHLTPAELIRHMLMAEIDLLFFGGIGTFVKARDESQAEAGDRANDALRVDGEALRAKVVGEGANLGVTQRGRIDYAMKGGRIDTDAIDNSAGVSMSDHEVNIKILLGAAIAAGALGQQERDPLLAQMADDVARLVLRDNYLQGEALSVAEARGPTALDRQARLMRELEKAGRLDRAIEFLPDEETLAARATARQGLTRPELAVLLAYGKMALDHELLVSDLPDAPQLLPDVVGYFPPALRERFALQIAAHPLRREIVATVVTNDLVNRVGMTFVTDLRAATGAAAADIARSYRIVRAVFALPEMWTEIEALDGTVAASVQTEMLLDIAGLVEHAAAWLLRRGRLDLDRDVARLRPSADALAGRLADLLPASERAVRDQRAARLSGAGVPSELAGRIGGVAFLASALEIADLAEHTASSLDQAARVYYDVGARFALDEMRTAARRLPAETTWQKQAVETVIDDVYALQAELAAQVLEGADGATDAVADWAARRAPVLAPAEALAAELRTAPSPDLAMLVVAARQLRQAIA